MFLNFSFYIGRIQIWNDNARSGSEENITNPTGSGSEENIPDPTGSRSATLHYTSIYGLLLTPRSSLRTCPFKGGVLYAFLKKIEREKTREFACDTRIDDGQSFLMK